MRSLQGGADSAVWYEDRISNGCRFEPNVSHAATMACDYDGINYIEADDGWGNLTVLSSQLGDIEPLGISGTFDHFQIRNSSVGRVGQSGLNLSATSFTIHSTEFRELSSHALDVRFNRSALLQMSSFMSVRANAFLGMVANPRRVVTLSFQQVMAHEADSGSLAFAEYGRVSQLDIALRMPCSCHPNRQALRLVAGDENLNDITDDQRRGARQVLAQGNIKMASCL
ncbi:hypothetical protein FJT64_016428 [Amphibalanus amphitrite]|uniref:Uncharacterized protein n=1 Tax=Amphibalanus amphitrite TaxID=1232801 RepID=A0A6A4XCP4_AMPAM|nr:hypothetical protein FJT64_016428 [Amphibalanus amphitrite]